MQAQPLLAWIVFPWQSQRNKDRKTLAETPRTAQHWHMGTADERHFNMLLEAAGEVPICEGRDSEDLYSSPLRGHVLGLMQVELPGRALSSVCFCQTNTTRNGVV